MRLHADVFRAQMSLRPNCSALKCPRAQIALRPNVPAPRYLALKCRVSELWYFLCHHNSRCKDALLCFCSAFDRVYRNLVRQVPWQNSDLIYNNTLLSRSYGRV